MIRKGIVPIIDTKYDPDPQFYSLFLMSVCLLLFMFL